jgi:F-type H+-transporting ATPase subunit gamma
VTPNRGLSGGLPTSLNRRAAQFIMDVGVPRPRDRVGKKGRDFVRRTGRTSWRVPEHRRLPRLRGHPPDSAHRHQDFIEGKADEVYILYAEFVNTVLQRPELIKLLPVEAPTEAETIAIDYIYEPTREAVLAELLPRYLERQLYGAILEAIASEQSARMVAMRNATDNANELIKDLTLVYNKARQESITSELLDITGGVEALKAS